MKNILFIELPNDPVTRLLLEELEINDDLLKFLKKKSLVDKEIETEIGKQLDRKSRIACLLQDLLEHDQNG